VEGPLQIGVLGAIRTRTWHKKNIKKAAKEFKRLGEPVVASGDLVGDETGDLPGVLDVGREHRRPIFAHSGNYE
jgi:hypothetical protein